MSEQYAGRDRLRELLDAVLDEDNHSLDDMAGDAYSSPYHFSRQLSRSAGEPPVAMKRRVMLERAAWQLRQGASVTDTAFAAGYESVEGFSRAFARAYGRAPSTAAHDAGSHWLPAPNGIHFHPPTSLWVHAKEQSDEPAHRTAGRPRPRRHPSAARARQAARRTRTIAAPTCRATRSPPGTARPSPSPTCSPNRSSPRRCGWPPSTAPTSHPSARTTSATLLDRHEDAAARWLATVRDIDRRGAWDDRLIDALCDPPESFVMSSVIAHVLTFSAHRRQLARQLLRTCGQKVDSGDPINWLRARQGEAPGEDVQ